MYAHSIDIVRSTAPSIRSTAELTFWYQSSELLHFACRSSDKRTIENGSTRTGPYIFQYCTPPYRQSFDYGKKCTADFVLPSSVFYELLIAKPLFGLINSLAALRRIEMLHFSAAVVPENPFFFNCAKQIICGMIVGFGLCTVGTKAKTISTISHRSIEVSSSSTRTTKITRTDKMPMISVKFFFLLPRRRPIDK